jgi:hypothetical protein
VRQPCRRTRPLAATQGSELMTPGPSLYGDRADRRGTTLAGPTTRPQRAAPNQADPGARLHRANDSNLLQESTQRRHLLHRRSCRPRYRRRSRLPKRRSCRPRHRIRSRLPKGRSCHQHQRRRPEVRAVIRSCAYPIRRATRRTFGFWYTEPRNPGPQSPRDLTRLHILRPSISAPLLFFSALAPRSRKAAYGMRRGTFVRERVAVTRRPHSGDRNERRTPSVPCLPETLRQARLGQARRCASS